MPWLWRPLWGTVWSEGERAGTGKGDRGLEDGKEGTDNAAGDGEQQVKKREGMPKWGVYVGKPIFNTLYRTASKPTVNEPKTKVLPPIDDVIDDVVDQTAIYDIGNDNAANNHATVNDIVNGAMNETIDEAIDEAIDDDTIADDAAVDTTGAPEEKEQQMQEKKQGDDDPMSKDVAAKETDKLTGQNIDSIFRRFEEVGPGVFQFKRQVVTDGWGTQPGVGIRQPVRVDPAWYRSALPSAIADYRKIGQTRDGLPIYSFK